MPAQKIERTELLHRCWEVLHRRGYHHTSINDLAQAAGLGKAGLLHHFGSKEGLMQAVLAYAMEQFRQYVLSVATEDLPLEQRIEKLLRRQNRLAKYERRGCFFGNTIVETSREGWFNPWLKSFFEEWEQVMTGLLSEVMPAEAARERAYRILLEYQGAVTFFKLTGEEHHLENFVHRTVAPFKPETV